MSVVETLKESQNNLDSPLATAMDSFSLIGPDNDIRQRSTIFENEHGIGLARLILLSADACCYSSTSRSSLVIDGPLTATVVQLHPAIERTRDQNGCVGSHSARRLRKNSRDTCRSSASTSGCGGAGHDCSRRCCRLLGRCWRRATTSGVVARTFRR